MTPRRLRLRQAAARRPVITISFPADGVPRNDEELRWLVRQIKRQLPGRTTIVHDDRLTFGGAA